MNLFIARDGTVLGDYPRERVEEMVHTGELLASDHYWHEGMTDWLLLGSLLPPETFEPLPPPPPPPNYLAMAGIGAAGLMVLGTIGFFMVKPDRSAINAPTTIGASQSPEALTGMQVRDKAIADLRQRIERLPSRAAQPLNALFYDMTVKMNRSLAPRTAWTAVIHGGENTIDPETQATITRTDFTVLADYKDGEWVYRHYNASISNVTDGTTTEIEQDENTPIAPTIVGMLGLKRSKDATAMSLKIPAN